MGSKIKVQRICQHCNNEFTARTTVTKYCGDVCAKRAYKARKRAKKIGASNKETRTVRLKPIEELKAKEFLTVKEAARLVGCSVRTAYRLVDNGTLKAVNLGERMTRIKRTELNRIFEQPHQAVKEIPKYKVEDCYNLKEVQEKYKISESGLRKLIDRHSIPKFKKGWYSYVPKAIIDKLLT